MAKINLEGLTANEILAHIDAGNCTKAEAKTELARRIDRDLARGRIPSRKGRLTLEKLHGKAVHPAIKRVSEAYDAGTIMSRAAHKKLAAGETAAKPVAKARKAKAKPAKRAKANMGVDANAFANMSVHELENTAAALFSVLQAKLGK